VEKFGLHQIIKYKLLEETRFTESGSFLRRNREGSGSSSIIGNGNFGEIIEAEARSAELKGIEK
jgi:hypothetical protein